MNGQKKSTNTELTIFGVIFLSAFGLIIVFLLFYLLIPKFSLTFDPCEDFLPEQQNESVVGYPIYKNTPIYNLDLATKNPSLEMRGIVLPELEEGKNYHIEVTVKEIN